MWGGYDKAGHLNVKEESLDDHRLALSKAGKRTTAVKETSIGVLEKSGSDPYFHGHHSSQVGDSGNA